MAIKKVIEIDVDQVQAMGGLEALQQSLVETETKSASLKAELRKLKEQLAQLPEGSEEYNKIAKQAGEVSDKIGDINTRIKNLGSDTKNIDAVVQGTQALSGAFTVATSASALLGEENKDLQETMLKVESAIGLTVGIQSIANALQKESALAIGLSTVATKIQTGAQVVYATVVGTTTGALKALRVALLSTGVGALVIALGFLIAKMTESTEVTEDQEKALDNLTESQKRYNDSLRSELAGIENSTKVRKLRAQIAGKSEKELLDIEKEGEKERATTFDNEIARIDKLLQNRKLSDKAFKLLTEERNKLFDESLKLAQERDLNRLNFELGIADKRRKAIEDANDEEKRKAKEKADELRRIEKEKSDAIIALIEKERSARIQAEYDVIDAIEKVKKENLESTMTPLELENARYQEQYDLAVKFAQDTEELEIQHLNNVNEINLQSQKIQYDADQKALEDKKILKQQELALSAETFGKIAEMLGKTSKVGKAFAVGQALINTYQGITAELATKAFTPYEIGLKVANIAFVASTGFKAVKQILSTNPMSSSGSGSASGGASGGGASSTPQFNLVGQSSTNQLTATIAGQQNRPVQTFVVGSQVSTQQALDRNAVANSIFG
jgi:hypothetical protein